MIWVILEFLNSQKKLWQYVTAELQLSGLVRQKNMKRKSSLHLGLVHEPISAIKNRNRILFCLPGRVLGVTPLVSQSMFQAYLPYELTYLQDHVPPSPQKFLWQLWKTYKNCQWKTVRLKAKAIPCGVFLFMYYPFRVYLSTNMEAIITFQL